MTILHRTGVADVRSLHSTSRRRIGALARHELRLTRTDPTAVVILTLVPILAMPFVRPLFGVFLQHEGYKSANGAEQAVPGFAILFALFLPSYIAISFFREHGCNTWTRLRATPMRTTQIVTGKLLVWTAIGVAQQAALFLGGVLLLHLHPRGSLVGLSLVATLVVANMAGLGILLAALCKTVNQVWAIGNAASLMLAGLGGALVPIAVLPGWAARIAPGVPSYWAMRGFNAVILKPGSIASVLRPVVVLAIFAIGFLVLGVMLFRADDVKQY